MFLADMMHTCFFIEATVAGGQAGVRFSDAAEADEWDRVYCMGGEL